MKLSKTIKIKKGYVFIDTCCLDNDLGNMLDMLGFGNSDAVAGGYETMVFKSNGKEVIDWTDLDKDNYLTEEEAIKGHKKMVTKWSKK